MVSPAAGVGTRDEARQPSHHRLARLVWTVAALTTALFLAKAFLGDVYALKSGSMRPTLFGGAAEPGGEPFREHVLVAYDRTLRPERFDLVVLRSTDGGAPLVKRVAALPGESVSIVDGDLLIDGRRLPPDAPRPAPIVVFDGARHDFSEFFTFERAPEGPWSAEGDTWVVDARGVEPRSRAGTMQLERGLRDDYVDQDARPVRGQRPVNDAILEGALALSDAARPDARVSLTLVEEGDTFQALLLPGEEGRLLIHIVRFNAQTLSATEPERKTTLLAEESMSYEPGRWFSFRFANVDNHLSFALDGTVVARASYVENEPGPPRSPGTSARGPRVALGAAGLEARFRELRVLRDLYYTGAGTYGTQAAVRLGLDEYFLLGDNSASSTDSRSFGPVPRGRLVGRPLAVVWPPARIRRLDGAVD